MQLVVTTALPIEHGSDVTADAAGPIEFCSATDTVVTAQLEGAVLAIESLQAAFGWSDAEMAIIEPAIWRAAALLPREQSAIDKAGRKGLSKIDHEIDRLLDHLAKDTVRQPLIVDGYDGDLEAFYSTVERIRDMQQRARETNRPRRRGHQSQDLRLSCKVLKTAWCATGRPYPHSDPDKPEAKSQAPAHVFIKWIISRLRPGRENDLRTILRTL